MFFHRGGSNFQSLEFFSNFISKGNSGKKSICCQARLRSFDKKFNQSYPLRFQLIKLERKMYFYFRKNLEIRILKHKKSRRYIYWRYVTGYWSYKILEKIRVNCKIAIREIKWAYLLWEKLKYSWKKCWSLKIIKKSVTFSWINLWKIQNRGDLKIDISSTEENWNLLWNKKTFARKIFFFSKFLDKWYD